MILIINKSIAAKLMRKSRQTILLFIFYTSQEQNLGLLTVHVGGLITKLPG
jgi:hypothetical protein